MRPKKKDENLKAVILQVRATDAEAKQYRAQAAARKMTTSAYLHILLEEDAEKLLKDGKLQQAQDGGWEYFAMGEWKRADSEK